LIFYTSARKLDERVAREIEISIRSGVLVNSRNESYDRRARNTARQSATIRKAHESHQLSDEVAEIDHEIEEIRVDKRESAARLKALQARKSEIRKNPKTATSAKRRTIFVSSNSSGRVKTKKIGIFSLLLCSMFTETNFI
jgi:septal ring factor EnvC (AmiA/AmiB activator)